MIHLVQYLCPSRHCIMAAPYDDSQNTYEYVQEKIKEAIERMGAKLECYICGSKELHFENAPTQYKTIEEAMPAMMVEAAKQILTRLEIEEQRRAERN